ncbi:MAG: EscU/YscU/HrcU family type III secretion system export apparatus switch protein [Acidimicrobiales bacterium]
MADNKGSQRSEKPTPKRLKEARRKGQIPRSSDLVGWFTLLVASYVVPTMLGALRRTLTEYLFSVEQALAAGELEMAVESASGLISGVGLVVVPFLLILAFVTAGGMAVQGGVTLSLEPLKPKLDRISPKAGIKRLVSAQSVVDTAKAVFRLVVLVFLVIQLMMAQIDNYLNGTSRSLAPAGIEIGSSLLLLVRLAAVVGIAVGLGDYAFQRYKIGKQLRMTKDEVKRENRNTEGDPLTRNRRRQQQVKLSQNLMLAAVGEASVVLVNPTHVAVALAYSPGGVPRVVAKGADAVAARIRERAFDADVPIVEVRPLARLLHDLIDVGSEVPAHLYEAVAIVIAFVMKSPSTSVNGSIRRVSIPNSKLVDSSLG